LSPAAISLQKCTVFSQMERDPVKWRVSVDVFGYMIYLCISMAIGSATSASGSDAMSGSHDSNIRGSYSTIKMHSIY
jgi:hypothetical protein